MFGNRRYEWLIVTSRSKFTIRWSAVLSILALAFAAWFVWTDFHHTAPNTFRQFYWAAKTMLAGGDIYSSPPPGGRAEYVYPPLFAFLITPLTGLGLLAAQRLWLLVDVALTWLALHLAAGEFMRRFRLPNAGATRALLCGGAFLLSVGEVKTEWATGQTDTLILLAFVLALRWIDALPWLAGGAIGFGANIKYQPIFALPWMLARRRWRAAAATVLAAGGFAVLPSLLTGWVGNLRDLRVAFAGLGNFAGVHADVAARTVNLTWIRSVSITSASGRLLEALHGNPARAFLLGGFVALVFLGVVGWIYRARGFQLFAPSPSPRTVGARNPGLAAVEWLGLMVAWLAFGPEVSRRHMFVLLLLHVAVLAVLVSPATGFRRQPLVIALVVWQLGLRLPPSSAPFEKASAFWNGLGGPSWCLLFFYATLLWSALDLLRSRPASALAGEAPPADEVPADFLSIHQA